MNKIKVGIIGATGYAGIELVRILLNHSMVEIVGLSSVSFEGKKISDIYPSLQGVEDSQLVNEDALIEKSDVVFASLPHGLSEKIAVKCLNNNTNLIDLGADFRLDSEEEFKKWYELDYTEKDCHKQSVYSVPELHRELVKGKKIIANPGCYPTSIALALAPVLKNGLIKNTIIADCKSGITGAGRGLSLSSHYPSANENFNAYKVANHRHTPEIEQTLSKIYGQKVKAIFVPHLLPVNRGILSTIYCDLVKDMSLDMLYDLYNDFYKNEYFVRLKKESANIRDVRCSNFCDISLFLDKESNKLIVISAIDNMVKGAAGQAVQNMNIMFGIEEKLGLDILIPTAF